MRSTREIFLAFIALSFSCLGIQAQDFGIRLTSVQKPMKKDVQATLTKVKAMGVTFVEVDDTYGLDPKQFYELCQAKGLSILSYEARYADLKKTPAKVIQTAKDLHAQYIVCGAIPYAGTIYTIDDANKLIKFFQVTGEKTNAEGIKLLYKPAGFEFAFSHEGREIFSWITNGVSSQYVNFILEPSGWGSYDFTTPAENLLNRNHDRFKFFRLHWRQQGYPSFTNGRTQDFDPSYEIGYERLLLKAKEKGIYYFFIDDLEIDKLSDLSVRHFKKLFARGGNSSNHKGNRPITIEIPSDEQSPLWIRIDSLINNPNATIEDVEIGFITHRHDFAKWGRHPEEIDLGDYVVFGEFVSEENARKAHRDLLQYGFGEMIYGYQSVKEKWFVLTACEDYEDARSKRSKYHKLTLFLDAWLMTVHP